jgi:hypothetical protein
MDNDEMLSIALGLKPGKVETIKMKGRPAKTARKMEPLKELTDEEKAAKAAERAAEWERREAERIEKYEENLAKQYEQAGQELDRLKRLRSEFPDLRVETDRWKKTRFKAKSANNRVTDIEFARTCGCCPDPGILARPYLETTLGRVYSNPFHIEIGEGRVSSGFVTEHANWEERFRKHGIPEALIQRMRQYIDAEMELAREADPY